MKHNIVRSAMLAATLLLFGSVSLAADPIAGASGEAKASGSAKAAGRKASSPAEAAKANKAAALAAAKLVDINSANKAKLKTLPGVSDEIAEKIIAGRPYGSKAQLVSRNIVSELAYLELKTLVIAKQK